MIQRNARDFSKYVGIPYSHHGKRPGLNCWELCEKIMVEIFGITPPKYSFDGDYGAVNSVFVAALECWQEVEYKDRRGGDLVLLNIGGLPIHLGILISDSTMIHTMEGIESVSEDIRKSQWQKRIAGIFRWNPRTQ